MNSGIIHGAILAGGAVMTTKIDNLVNAKSNGFKPALQELLAASYAESQLGNGAVYQGNGVRTGQTISLFEQGEIEFNKTELDVAVQGRGMFILTDQDGNIFYTRNGAFSVDANGILVHAASRYQVGTQAIQITAQQLGSLKIDEKGKVTCKGDDGKTDVELGFLELVDFPSRSNLKRERYGLFAQTALAGEEEIAMPGENGMGLLTQHALESSGTDLIGSLIEINDLSQYMMAVGQNAKIMHEMYRKVMDSMA